MDESLVIFQHSSKATNKLKIKLSGQIWITVANVNIDTKDLYHLKQKVGAI